MIPTGHFRRGSVLPAVAISGLELVNRWYYDPDDMAIIPDCANSPRGVGQQRGPHRRRRRIWAAGAAYSLTGLPSRNRFVGLRELGRGVADARLSVPPPLRRLGLPLAQQVLRVDLVTLGPGERRIQVDG